MCLPAITTAKRGHLYKCIATGQSGIRCAGFYRFRPLLNCLTDNGKIKADGFEYLPIIQEIAQGS